MAHSNSSLRLCVIIIYITKLFTVTILIKSLIIVIIGNHMVLSSVKKRLKLYEPLRREQFQRLCSLQAAMLPSAEFSCMRVAYREALWEELSTEAYMNGAFDTAAIAVFSTCIIFPSLPARVSCSFQGKLFSIFKFSLPRFC